MPTATPSPTPNPTPTPTVPCYNDEESAFLVAATSMRDGVGILSPGFGVPGLRQLLDDVSQDQSLFLDEDWLDDMSARLGVLVGTADGLVEEVPLSIPNAKRNAEAYQQSIDKGVGYAILAVAKEDVDLLAASVDLLLEVDWPDMTRHLCDGW